MTSRPAYSPCEPALGCSDTAAKPVISASQGSRRSNSSGSPRSGRAAQRGGGRPNSGQVTGIISVVALSFIVHEPSGIIEWVSDRSRALQPPDVAQHLRLGVVAVEDRMGQEVAGRGQCGASRGPAAARPAPSMSAVPYRRRSASRSANSLTVARLVEGDADRCRRRYMRRLICLACASRGDLRPGCADRR